MSKTKLGPDYLSMLTSTNNLHRCFALITDLLGFSKTSIMSGSSTNAIYVASRGRMAERERGSIIGRVR